MRKPITKISFSLMALFVCLAVHSVSAAGTHVVQIHYLGHAGFILQFDNGIGIVTDYAAFHDIGGFKPDVATYSHGHEDHAGGYFPNEIRHILSRSMSLEIDGISIKPIITSESSAGVNDNSSYLFTYKNFKILHLGDAQGDISEIAETDEQAHLRRILPEKIDLLLMPIGSSGRRNISNKQAEAFIDFVQPRVVIPMHYWTSWGKRSFLKHLERRNKTNGNRYRITKVKGPKYAIDLSRLQASDAITIISLEGSDY